MSHLRRYQEQLPHATSRLIDGSEHSFVNGLPQLVRDIQAFSDQSRTPDDAAPPWLPSIQAFELVAGHTAWTHSMMLRDSADSLMS